MIDICLVVMPFGSVHRPAIGVSLLKAGLRRRGFSCKIFYFNIRFAEQIGLHINNILSETSLDSPMIGELIFSSFAFNEFQAKFENIPSIANQILGSKRYSVPSVDKLTKEIREVRERIPEFLEDCEDEILRNKPKMVGFTSTFEQNCASLAIARKIKEDSGLPIILGGANCEGEMGISILKCAPWIDFICSGEGEIAFTEFVSSFFNDSSYKSIRGILTRNSNPFEVALTNPVLDMDSLPYPDFEDFFTHLRYSPLARFIKPELVIETSRGCWWGEKFQCTFCGLNGSTMKYRSKSASRVLEELAFLVRKYKIKKFQVVDNILDLKYFDQLFPQISGSGLVVDMFYETKSNISKKQLMQMKQGGVKSIQPGIESLSDSILRIMKKGVTALQNIQVLKWCRELGIIPSWNIIWGFPGEPQDAYDEMVKVVSLLVHLHPPGGFGKITLDRFSPYFVEPTKNGITNIRPWIAYNFMYPLDAESLRKIAYHFDFDYEDKRDPDSYTAELKRQLLIWKGFWRNDRGKDVTPPILSMVNNGNVVMIKDTRPCSIGRYHLLTDITARIYIMCGTQHSFQSIHLKIQQDNLNIQEEEIRDILTDLESKKIMLVDKDVYLSLAVPVPTRK